MTVNHHSHPRCTVERETEQDRLLEFADPRLRVCIDVGISAFMDEDYIARSTATRPDRLRPSQGLGVRQVLHARAGDEGHRLGRGPRRVHRDGLRRLGHGRAVVVRRHAGRLELPRQPGVPADRSGTEAVPTTMTRLVGRSRRPAPRARGLGRAGRSAHGRLIGRVHLPASACPRGVGGPTPVPVRDGRRFWTSRRCAPTVADLLERDDLGEALDVADLPVVGAAARCHRRESSQPSSAGRGRTSSRRSTSRSCAPVASRSRRASSSGSSRKARAAMPPRRAGYAARLGGGDRGRPGRDRARLRTRRSAQGASSSQPAAGRSTSRSASVRIPRSSRRRRCSPRSGPDSRSASERDSAWNNPEPEVVLAVDSRGRIVGRDARQRRQPARHGGPQRAAARRGEGQQRELRDRSVHPAVRRRDRATGSRSTR